MMGVRGKAVSRQAHLARVCVVKEKEKKVELPLGLSLAPSVVLIDAFVLWIG